MTLNDIKAEMQQLRNERTEFLRRAELAQDCLNELQRKMAMMKLEAQRNHYKKQSQAKSEKQKKGNV